MSPKSTQLFDKIKTSKNLPSLPHILLKLIDACNNEAATIQEISKIINKDSSLSARVMKMVNSVYYGLPMRITNVEQALLMLGTQAVKNIAVSAAVFRVFGITKSDDVFNLKVFWYHCLLCATVSEMIAKKVSYNSPDEAFLSGLLHDIGKLVFWVNFPKDYTEVLRSGESQQGLPAIERRRFGANHCEVGAWMIGQWHLQSFMADAVLYHHEDKDKIKDALPLVKIVCLANALSNHADQGDELALEIAQDVFGFAQSDVKTLLSEGEKKVEDVAESLGIGIQPPAETASDLSDREHQKDIDLLRNVRDVSLLQGTLQNLLEAHNQETILAIVKQGLQVLFDSHNVLFLLYDAQEAVLAGKGGLEPPRDTLVRELTISLETRNCLPVQSLEKNKPLDSFGQLEAVDLTILDRQLIRLLEKDGILCLPMTAHKHRVGVIVLGINQASFASLSYQKNLLNMFAQQSALALYAEGLREAQVKVIESERFAAASAVAKKVAHEVNNPLGIIKNYIKIFGLKLSAEDPAHEELKIITEELDRVAFIVGKLSDLSEQEAIQKEPVDINVLVSDLIKITRESLAVEAKVNTQLDLKPSLPVIFSEKNTLKQVLINLIKNAVEAMPQGGNLNISTDYVPKRRMGQSEKPSPQSGSVQICITDEGPGIPEAIQTRLFEPFVTSKKAGHAGLGLSVAYNIVKGLGGTITCESAPEKGTTFNVVLPVGPSQEA